MDNKTGICPILDGIGLTALVIAIFALGGSVWFLDLGTQGKLMEVFQMAFSASVVCFLGARVIQIVDIIRNTPDPKSLRVVAATPDSSLETATPQVVAGEIRQAA
ncbi:MAG: hypothetical protein AAF387_01050 [Pseudomonadota bacterium]